jgi:ribosomal protein L37AE/L43A
MKFEIIAGDFPKETQYSGSRGSRLTFIDDSKTFFGLALNKSFMLNGEVVKLDLITEENKSTLLRSTAWGLTGMAVGGLIAAPVAIIAGLAGLRKSKKEVCFACHLKDGRKFLAVADIAIYQELSALAFSAIASPVATFSDAGQRDEIDCPYCAEKILARAKLCKHCGRTVRDPAERTATHSATGLNSARSFERRETSEITMPGQVCEHKNAAVAVLEKSDVSLEVMEESAGSESRPTLVEGFKNLTRFVLGGLLLFPAIIGLADGWNSGITLFSFYFCLFLLSFLVLPPIPYFNNFSIIQEISIQKRLFLSLAIFSIWLCILVVS